MIYELIGWKRACSGGGSSVFSKAKATKFVIFKLYFEQFVLFKTVCTKAFKAFQFILQYNLDDLNIIISFIDKQQFLI